MVRSGDPSGDDSDVGSTGSASSATSRRNRRRRQKNPKVEDIELKPLPAVPAFRRWLIHIENKLIAAIELDDDIVYEWFKKASDRETADEDARKLPKWAKRLDAKFRAALMDII